MALRSQTVQQRLYWWYWWIALTAILTLFGLYGTIRAIPPGGEEFGTNPTFEWGLLIAAYVFFVVSSTGLCLVSSLGHVFGIERYKALGRRAILLAIITLISGFGVIALDLKQYPFRLVFGMILSPSPRSPMWWMGALYSLYLVFLVIEFWGLLTEKTKIARLGGSLAFIAAVSAHSNLGAVFGLLVGRPYWHGAYLPIYFILSALVSGAAILGIVFFLVNALGLKGSNEQTKRLVYDIGTLLGLFLGIYLFFTVWHIISGLYGHVPGQYEATMALVAGPLSLHFWPFKVFIGLLLPFLLLTMQRTRTMIGVFAASILTLIGIFVDRIELVEAGQIVPPTVISGNVSFPYAHYSPSLVEISIVVGAVGFTLLTYSLAERYIHLGESIKTEH